MSFEEPRNIELSDKDHISEVYHRYGRRDSAHSFESCFIWKDEMNLRVVTAPDFYAIREISKNGNSWFFPVGDDDVRREFIRGLLDEGQANFFYMTGKDALFLDENFPGRFTITEAPESSEYIIDRQTMEELPGKSFTKVRGYINRLCSGHEIDIVDVRGVEKKVIYDIIIGWDVNRHLYEEIPDKMATKNIINHMEDLGLSGIVLYMDGEPCSVCAGFNLDDDMADCVIQKNRISMQGLTYYLRQEYARSCPASIKYFNWEEDLGIEGLRQAKELMRPCSMITMYTGRSNEE